MMALLGRVQAHRRATYKIRPFMLRAPDRPACRTRHALLAGVSLSALAAVPLAPAARAATPLRPLSPAWFAARVDASTAAGAAAAASGSAATSTLNQVTTATRNLAQLATRLQQLHTTQAAAMAAALAAPSTAVPNGLVLGGLQPAQGVVAGAPGWTGADLPSQVPGVSGRTEVAVRQTAPQASLTWQTFNVGSKTELTFDQTAGGASASNWVVLNRIEDPAAQPSQILGSITAPGKVYVVNANGILFGAGSQINLGALIAATAQISDAQFATGLYGAQSGTAFLPTFTAAPSGSLVLVQEGAAITTAAPSAVTSGGGYVMLLGGAVENDGAITTPNGQTVLAAGQDFILRSGYSTSGNQTATVLGSQVATTGKLGSATNGSTGLISATLGDVTLVGHAVTQAGVVLSTTSVNTRGTVHLLTAIDDPGAMVTLAPGSVTSVDPDNAATTALDSQRQSLIDQSAANNALRTNGGSTTTPQLNDVGYLPDRLDLSRIEITSGGTVAFDNSSLTLSQGGQIAVQAGLRNWVGDGAALDVSGSTGAVLPMSSNSLVVNIQGNELRDAPVNRDAALITSNNVSLEIPGLVQVPASAADPNTRYYTSGGLLEVGGYLANIGHTIDEWTAVAGTITLAADAVITQPQASLNIAGGSVAVSAGELAQSYLIGPGGQLYNVNTAPANIPYSGVYKGLTVDYERFGGSATYTSPVATPAQIYQSGYTFGRDAGGLVITAPTAVLEGAIGAGVSNGSNQTVARPAIVTDGYGLTQTTIAQPGTLTSTGLNASGKLFDTAVAISGDYTPVADTIGVAGALPAAVALTLNLSAPMLNAAGLGGLSITTNISIDLAAPLTLAPGGTLTLRGANVTIDAGITARGGRITATDALLNPVSHDENFLLSAQGGSFGIGAGATIDLRGEWTNLASNPTLLTGEGLVNGGTLTIDSVRGLQVASGSVIDTSSGGALLAGGKQVGGKGGDVTLIGDDPVLGAQTTNGISTEPVQIGATLRDAGVLGGGTLTLTAAQFVIGSTPATPIAANAVLLDPATFQAGFSDYVINGFAGLTVLPATVVTVAAPVYVFYGTASSPNAPTGEDPSSVFSLILPPTYLEDRANARLTQRQGARVAFISNDSPGSSLFGGGTIDLGAGAVITVDPLQSVRVEAYGQITDDAAIIAPGGTVALVNEQRNVLAATETVHRALSLSVWIGGDASIDVAGRANTASDLLNRPYGTVTAGGTITLGSDGGVDTSASQITTDASIVVRPGAVLNASGAAATIDLLAGTAPILSVQSTALPPQPVLDATAGGTIRLSSDAGIFDDGTLLAAAGGAGASGGSLSITLEDPFYPFGTVIPRQLLTPRVLSISQTTQSTLGALALAPGQNLPQDAYGTATISQQQIAQAGFSNVSLYARDVLLFQDDVTLQASGSISLNQGIIADSSTSAAVILAAPHVSLTGETALNAGDGAVTPSINTNTSWHPFADPTSSTFTVDAALIDLVNLDVGNTAAINNLRFGVREAARLGPDTGQRTIFPGFADLTFDSGGDIRFGTGTVTTPGNVTLQGAQVYPITGAAATVFAGYDQYHGPHTLYVPDGSITILPSGATPGIPLSVGGSLSLFAGAVVQDGVLRAPEGHITLGAIGAGPAGLTRGVDLAAAFTSTVALGPGSVTSVSLEGATIPYGGTTDGVTYTYDGSAVGSFTPAITLAGQVQTIDAGALVDLAGGGSLSGAGFVSGRGGSTDLLTNPLLAFNASAHSVAAPSLATDPVYAILPGYGSAYAPITPLEAAGTNGSVPLPGSQITIGEGVPGIPAGTYTLLPSYDTFLPGAARVQINTGTIDTVPGAVSLGAGSYALNATTSLANTGVVSALPVGVIVTTGPGIAASSQFDTESYSTFILAQAAKFGTVRGSLPEDGKTLNLNFPAQAARVNAFSDLGTVLLQAQPGYFGGTATVGGQGTFSITPDTTTLTPDTQIEASALDALNASRLIIGGSLASFSDPSILMFAASAEAVTIVDGADLRAPEVFLTATGGGAGSRIGPRRGAVNVEDGAIIDTTHAGAPAFDSSNGFYYNADANTLVAVSNGDLVFTPSPTMASIQPGAITIADGASLLTDGTLYFSTDKQLSLGAGAIYGARTLSVAVDNINIVGADALTGAAAGTPPPPLPTGFTLTQDVLATLLAGDPALGTPALQNLVLTANKTTNVAGTVSLNTIDPATGLSSLQVFVLNTPAIYGAGIASDVATITAGTLYLDGVQSPVPFGGMTTTPGSALPGAVIAGGPGTGAGTLNINAQTIVLGAGPDAQPNDQITLDQLIEGFATVDLSASSSLSANNRGALSVYQAVTTYGAPGTGGDLNITTPLLTGAAGSVDAITAGGTLAIAAPATGASPATTGALGAELDLHAGTISDASTVLLNAGRLTMTATGGDLTLAAGTRIDLAGTAVGLLDQTRYSNGGTLVLTADTGAITTDAGSSIDVSATNAAAGQVLVTATGGLVTLDGALTGKATAGYGGGGFDLRAGSLTSFDDLNTVLDTGGIFGARTFEIATGNIVVDHTVQAHAVGIAADTGTLTVIGTIDASGAAVGSIVLSAGGDLIVQDGALLDAHGSTLIADSTGAPIEAENRASIALTTQAGTLTLGDATIDVGSAAATPLGQVTLTAPQILSNGAATGDVMIAAAGPINILGAQTIALYGSRTYTPTDANGTVAQHAGIAGAVTLDQLNTDNAAFLTASATSGLPARRTGLSAYGSAYHLRPADVIQSSAASGGNLTVNGDLDLSTLRYGAPAGSAPGAGEVGLLTLRAADNLVVNGSISDGFATPVDAITHTPDDKGWLLYASEPLGQAVTLPQDLAAPIELRTGTTFATSGSGALNYAITIAPATLAADVVVPGPVVTGLGYTVPAGGITATAMITAPGPNGTTITIATAGQLLAAGTSIPAGATLAAGTVLPFAVRLASGTTWPAGAPLSAFTDQQVKLVVPPHTTFLLHGGDIVPGGSSLVFLNNANDVSIRPRNASGVQGLIYAAAPLLPAGSQSWSINLVAGANLAGADPLAVQTQASLAAADDATTATDPPGSIVLSDNHYTLAVSYAPTTSFSVVRTGTGTLNLVAGGNVDEASLFGVYTAGTQTSLGAAQDTSFAAGRATQLDGTVLGRNYKNTYGAIVAAQTAYYPDHGGNVLVAAQNDVVGHIVPDISFGPAGSDNVGNWLWRQGGSGIGQTTSWWINFGSYVLPLDSAGNVVGTAPVLTGFSGIGALGGGNVTVQAGGDAGEVAPDLQIGQGLVLAVASTGRVTSVASSGAGFSGTTALTGGGGLSLDIAGTINPAVVPAGGLELGGTLTDMRGNIGVQAGQLGTVGVDYGPVNLTDPRPQDPFTSQYAFLNNGLIVVPGDTTVTINTMRDLVLAGTGDPGRQVEQAFTSIPATYLPARPTVAYGGTTGFSLWTSSTAVDLFAAGGNLAPITNTVAATTISNDAATDNRFIYPATLDAVAASGNMYYGASGFPGSLGVLGTSLELAPSPIGQLSLLAAGSIYAHGYAVDMSGADPSGLSSPYNPAYTDLARFITYSGGTIYNFDQLGHPGNPDQLFAFEADTPTGNLHLGDTVPARIYAATGDLVDVQFGEVLNFRLSSNVTPGTWYLAAKPAEIIAGRDIVGSGTRPQTADPTDYNPATFAIYPNEITGPASLTTGDLLLNVNTTDISVVSAGRDILGSYVYVAGPGLLEIDAGRNIDQTGDNGLAFGVFKSVGPIIGAVPSARSGGAAISILTGTGSVGPDYSTFAALYLNAANQADVNIPLSEPANQGKVQQTYQVQLYAWLQANYGYTGSEDDALAFFATLPPLAQDIFDRSVFFQELQASGRQESDPASLFYKSYARGRTAIATLFPSTDAAGSTISYDGGLTMTSGPLRLDNSTNVKTYFDAGISTLFGGSIQILSPGGSDVFGTTGGPAPGASSGVTTQGSGDIDIYALSSVLLGQSRIFTTFGGNILIWSAEGDINAGRGAKTTVIYPPPLIAYDPYGSITLAPAVPTNGAGIATLAPIAGTLPGNVDLIAPLGTVDAGEAGIRVSGNLNIAAATVLNAANVQVGGKTAGNTAVVAVNTQAAAAASATAGASVNAATNAALARARAQTILPSIITVEILGAGNDDERRRRRPAA